MLEKIRNWSMPLLIGFLCLAYTLSLHLKTVEIFQLNQYKALVNALLDGQTNIDGFEGGIFHDYALFAGKKYIYFGLFPTLIVGVVDKILRLPGFYTVWIMLFLIMYTAYSLGRNYSHSKIHSLWLALFLLFGTPVWAVMSFIADPYYAQLVGFSCLLVALFGIEKKSHPVLIGLLVALAFLSRHVYLLAALYFVGHYLFLINGRLKERIVKIGVFLLPILIGILITFYYNFHRFNSIMESGYSYNIINQNSAISDKYGVFSLKYIPVNLFYLLFSGPKLLVSEQEAQIKTAVSPYLEPDPFGMSVFMVSPLLLVIFMPNHLYKKQRILMVITTLFLLFPSLLYSGTGFVQFGNRYLLDYLPFLYVLVLHNLISLKKHTFIPLGAFYSVAFNFMYMASVWKGYVSF